MKPRSKASTCDLDVPSTMIVPSGAIAGCAAGIVLAFALGLQALSRGLSFAYPFRLLSRGFFNDSTRNEGLIWLLAGVGLHFSASIALGIGFSYLIRCHVPGDQNQVAGDRAFVSGVGYGAMVWVGMTFILLPAFNPTFRSYVMRQSLWWFLFHVFFGVTLMMVPDLRRALMRRSYRKTQRPHEDRPSAAA